MSRPASCTGEIVSLLHPRVNYSSLLQPGFHLTPLYGWMNEWVSSERKRKQKIKQAVNKCLAIWCLVVCVCVCLCVYVCLCVFVCLCALRVSARLVFSLPWVSIFPCPWRAVSHKLFTLLCACGGMGDSMHTFPLLSASVYLWACWVGKGR